MSAHCRAFRIFYIAHKEIKVVSTQCVNKCPFSINGTLCLTTHTFLPSINLSFIPAFILSFDSCPLLHFKENVLQCFNNSIFYLFLTLCFYQDGIFCTFMLLSVLFGLNIIKWEGGVWYRAFKPLRVSLRWP